MPRVSFEELPDRSRMWVFPADRALNGSEQDALLEEVDRFLDGWAAHGQPLRSGRELREEQFLLVGVDEDAEAASGCSIDALVNRLRAFGRSLGVSLVDHAPVWVRQEGRVVTLSRSDFRRLAREGQIDETTKVFDTTLTRLGVLRAEGLERPAGRSWHGEALLGTLPPG